MPRQRRHQEVETMPSDNLHISSGRVRTRTVAGCIRGRGLGKPVLLLEVQRALRPSF